MVKLNEDSRSQLINQSKRADNYSLSNRDLGKNRHQRRLKSKFSNSVKEFNQINMNKFFKDDIVDVNVRVNGETNVYLVKISFNGILNALAGFLPKDADESDIDFRAVVKSLLDAFNHNDVYVHCTCPDFQYREAYWATINGTNSGAPETRPSDETNPNDTKGYCKHINLVLNNNSWLMKVASVINNYIKYMRETYPKKYANIIYPAIFNREYEEPVQQDMLDTIDGKPEDELDTDSDTIDISNKWARTKNQFKKGNQSGVQFAKADEDEPIDGQEKMFDIDSLTDGDEEQELDNTKDEE